MNSLGRATALARVANRHVNASPASWRRSSESKGSGSRPLSRAWWPLLLAWPAVTSSSRETLAAAAEQQSGVSAESSLTGIWIRDNDASDLESYDRMLGLMQLSGLQRTTALRLIEGVELEQTEAGLSIAFLTVVPFFKVREEVSFGREVAQTRRDLRPGEQIARAAAVRGGVYVEMRWGEPVAGFLSETYSRRGDTLLVRSALEIGGRQEETTVVYRRSSAWRPRFTFPGS